MAFLLSSLGVLSHLGGAAGSHVRGHGIDPQQTGNPYASSFGSVLSGQMDAMGASDPLAQLTALVQNGTPLSTVIDRLAANVAGALQARLPANAGIQARGAVVRSIKSALSPPSNAPPGTAAQEVAALARRLQAWLSGVARGADQRVGQQSDTSGQVLDANRARELPAHNDPESASSQLDVSALARSLLAQVAASFGASSAASGSPLSAHDAVAAFSEGAKTAAQDAGASARLQAGLAAAPTPNDPSQPGVQSQPAIASNASVQTQPHADPAGLLARMLLRAAGVDARFNGAAIATALVAKGGAERAASRAPVGPGTPAESTASAGRLGAVLSETIAAASSGGGAASGDSFGDADASANASTVTAAKATTTTRADAIAFALPTASPSSALHGAAESGSLPTGTPVDPSAIVEQVVKGLSMRTLTDGTSEVRLRLVPEQLGAVSLHLTVDGSNVSATAVAQNADVRNALVAQQHHLARSLADAGLKLTGFTVNLSGGDAGNDRNRDRTSGFGRHYAVHEVTASGTDLTESSSAGPALLPESTLALFNYLA